MTNSESRVVEVRKDVLKHNDMVAHELRSRFRDTGTHVVNLVSSPGSGTTALLERTLLALQAHWRVAALIGDLATENDVAQLMATGARVKQITTGTACHLDADMIMLALHEWLPDRLEFLFIENAGDLSCPAPHDLGESLRLVLMSVTEGEDKPLRYPTIFNRADVALITKTDMARGVDFDWNAAYRNIHAVRPGVRIIRVSAKSGEGMPEYIDLLESRTVEPRPAASGTPAS